jgi:hypothetical protein
MKWTVPIGKGLKGERMELKYLLLIIPVIVFGYVVWRLLTYGTFRSYFQAKLWFHKKQKEECDARK